MNRTYKGLKLLSSFSSTAWELGKNKDVIKNIYSKISTLPPHVFDNFFISTNPERQISAIDFALLTYDMAPSNRKALMEQYGIDYSTIDCILKVADEIGKEINFSVDNEIK